MGTGHRHTDIADEIKTQGFRFSFPSCNSFSRDPPGAMHLEAVTSGLTCMSIAKQAMNEREGKNTRLSEWAEPTPRSVEAVRENLPKQPEFHLVPLAGHLDFLAACRAGYKSLPICRSAPEFDRVLFHSEFNAALISFFDRNLAPQVRAIGK